MKTHIMPYFFNEHTIRVIEIDGEPWWFLTDICRVLEIKNAAQLANSLEDYQKRTLSRADVAKIMTISNSYSHSVDNLFSEGRARGGAQYLTVVNESGIYGSISKSRVPAAKAFNRWLTTEVLPSIRKYGFYDPARFAQAEQLVIADETFDAGRDRPIGERFREEIARFERDNNTTFEKVFEYIYPRSALKAFNMGLTSILPSLTKGERWMYLMSSGFDLPYILWGTRTLTDAERLMRETMRALSVEQQRVLITNAIRLTALERPAIEDADDSDD